MARVRLAPLRALHAFLGEAGQGTGGALRAYGRRHGVAHFLLADQPDAAVRCSSTLEHVLERLEAGEAIDGIADARAVARHIPSHRWWATWLERNVVRWRRAGADSLYVTREASAKTAGCRAAVVQAAWEAPLGHPARALAPAGQVGLGHALLVRRPPDTLVPETRYVLDDPFCEVVRVAPRPRGGLVASDDRGRVLLFSSMGRQVGVWELGGGRVTGLAVVGDVAYTASAEGVYVVCLNAPGTEPEFVAMGTAPVTVFPWPEAEAVVVLDADGNAHRVVDAVVTGSVATGLPLDPDDVVAVAAPVGEGLVVCSDSRLKRFVWIEAASDMPVVRSDSERPIHPDGEAVRAWLAGFADVTGPLADGLLEQVPLTWGARAVWVPPSGLAWETPDGRELASGGLSTWDAPLDGCWTLADAGLFLLWGFGEVILFDTGPEGGESPVSAEASSGVQDRVLWRRAVPDVRVMRHGDRLLLVGSDGVTEVCLSELERLRGGPTLPLSHQRPLCCWRAHDAATALVATADGSLVAASAAGLTRLSNHTFWKGGFATSGAVVVIWRRGTLILPGSDGRTLRTDDLSGRRPGVKTPAIVAVFPTEAPGSFLVICEDGRMFELDGELLAPGAMWDLDRQVRGAYRVGGCVLLSTGEGEWLQRSRAGEVFPLDLPVGGHCVPSPKLSAAAVMVDGSAIVLAPGVYGLLEAQHWPTDNTAPVHWASESTLCQVRSTHPGHLDVLLFERDPAQPGAEWQTRQMDAVRIPPGWESVLDPAKVRRCLRMRDADGDWCVVGFERELVLTWNVGTGSVFNPAQPVAFASQLPPAFRANDPCTSLGRRWIAASDNDTALLVGTGETAFPAWQGERRVEPLALLRGGVAVVSEGGDVAVLHPTHAAGDEEREIVAESASFRVQYLGATRLA